MLVKTSWSIADVCKYQRLYSLVIQAVMGLLDFLLGEHGFENDAFNAIK